MKKNNTLDALAMQMDRAKKLLNDEDDLTDTPLNSNNEAEDAMEESNRRYEENLAFARSLIDISDEELAEARKKALAEKDNIFTEPEEEPVEEDITYEEIVEIAHAQGYENVRIQDLLTAEEIAEANAEYDAIEKAFKEKTKLNKVDVTFLITAVAFQVVRQYVLDPIIKEHRKNAGSDDEEGHEKKGPGWYYVPTDKILVNAVPFDAIKYSDYKSVKGFLKGFANHRDATLGHDPILGWIFGTANIMTGTITNCKLDSAHVKYVHGKGPVIHSNADTTRIFTTIYDRVTENFDGVLALVFAIIREAQHLKSDVNTKHSLALPGLNVLCPEFAAKLAKYGIDTASVGTEMALSGLINFIISCVHRIIMPEDADEELYEVKTRKILLISNSIASASNVVAVGIAAGIGVAGDNPKLVKNSINYLDVGGLLVTISRLFFDTKFILEVKKEFINATINEQLEEQLNRLDELAASMS